eukprot:CAMPEP_0115849920 /NCGR_PEP_ID=MMETSP0287-20121206/11699_1 /TAXON_ID=412157 /ORGANISM="Chrysochromulina rotalis, Strain UIO044" /LENGTH=246 /DNA_ID=CAMNT_0003303905 /DNA_START=420 /DNA_END=1160 /DNA_ORIENTATION=+
MMRTRDVEERGVGRTAKRVTLELDYPNANHLAASGRFNRDAEAWEQLADKLGPQDETAADVEERCLPHQWTLLQCAARQGTVDDVERLIAAGADVNVADIHASTPLHAAARSGSADKIERLVAAGADIEARDRYGHSPLHVACANEQPAAVRALVLCGADVGAKDGPLHDGDTPWQVANSFGFTKVCEVLKTTERQPFRLSGGLTQLIPADSILLKNSPAAFSSKRMSVKPVKEPRWGLVASAKSW